MELEQDVQCPTCWEANCISIDALEGTQCFVEDCWVCCRPMTIHCTVQDDTVIAITVEPAS
jgi:hypothetical protein